MFRVLIVSLVLVFAIPTFTSTSLAQEQKVVGIGQRDTVKKILLKRHLKTLMRKADKEKAEQIKEVLQNDDLFEATFQGLSEKYSLARSADGAFLDSLQNFLNFLVENQDAILALIEALIKIFAIDEPQLRTLIDSPQSISLPPATREEREMSDYWFGISV